MFIRKSVRQKEIIEYGRRRRR